ncbi:phage tail tape measure protein [Erwinia phage phiEt88]|uniref:tail length tape measure protein n=1 Tax=Erwinia phage phiEt88 TaxID=925984 RepID=UPI0001F1FC62|nr:tail length tape measure protein [Erwinia phage phiEt88]CBX44529.1 phage tail tape measure protein [Erwinia phage phiEt88]
MVIRELLIRLGLDGGAKVGQELDKVDSKVKNVTSSFQSMGAVLAGAFAGISLKSILDTADHMQSLEFRLGQMITSANGGAEALDNLAAHAQSSRVDIESYAEAYTGIGAATHELIHTEQDLLNVTDSVAKGLQLAGASTQQTTSVMMQLTQAIAVGKLQWADMRIIMQNSDAFALRIAKSMGMTLNQMVQATQGNGGGIGADKLVDALRSMSGEVNAEFKSMPLTFTQGLTIIGARWEVFVHKLNRSSGAVTWLADKFLWMADKVEYSLDVVVEALGGAENAVKILGVAVGAAGLVGGIWLLSAAFTALTSPILLIVGALGLLYLVGDDINEWLNGNKSLLGDMVGPATDYKNAIDELKTSLNDMKDMAIWALNALNNLAGFFNSGQDAAQSWGDRLGTTQFAPWLKEKAGWLAQDLGGWASWGNKQTNGAFDVPKMWTDMVGGMSRYNADKSYQSTLTPNYQSFVPQQSTSSPAGISVSIGNITVPAGTSSDQVEFLRDSAQRTFNDAGWAKLGDNLNFNTGG